MFLRDTLVMSRYYEIETNDMAGGKACKSMVEIGQHFIMIPEVSSTSTGPQNKGAATYNNMDWPAIAKMLQLTCSCSWSRFETPA